MVQRQITNGLVSEAKEVMVPATILNQILRCMPVYPSLGVEQAFIELKKIMDTEI